MQLISQVNHTLPGYAFLHDFSVTQHYYVIFRNPVSLHLMPFILGQKSAVHSVHWHDRQSLAAHLVPRPPSAPAPLDQSMCASHNRKPCSSKIHIEEFACGGSSGTSCSSTSCSSKHRHNCRSNAVNDAEGNHVSTPADSSESSHTQYSCDILTESQSATSPSDCQRRDMSSLQVEGQQHRPFWVQQSSADGHPGSMCLSQQATAAHGCSLCGRQQAPNKNSTVPVAQRKCLQQASAESTRAAPVQIVQVGSCLECSQEMPVKAALCCFLVINSCLAVAVMPARILC